GLPNFRPKLPSRNWLIFFGIVGTWTGLIIHDRREKKRIQADWCARVAHLSQAPLQINELPRKITIYLAAPPGDGIGAARDYFREYVKPVLVAAAVDYDVVEGRRGGEAEWGEKGRKAAGETLEDGEEGRELEIVRARLGIRKEVEDEESGVMVIGRHTWKEFVRGVHDGWLGPADSQVTELPPPREEGKPVPRPAIPRPTIEPEEYGTKPLPPSFPKESNSLPVCSPVAVVPYPHLLGFLNTPWRIYRYLNQRHLADQVARETAALCLGFSRPFQA
ncbi:mitochondrial import inner membrane translocase subunit Tim54, partial [Kalaharituber pfeilii]